jgi:4-aminobutyrate aminotransferase-like enzyme
MGNVVTLTPPLTTTRAEMDDALDRIEAAMVAAAASLGR